MELNCKYDNILVFQYCDISYSKNFAASYKLLFSLITFVVKVSWKNVKYFILLQSLKHMDITAN